jgi:uncharacterized protein YndB with AHSA1/START domain
MDMQTPIEPVVKTLSLNASCEKAFRHFTDNIHLWWPIQSHSLAEKNAETVKFEAREGGRIYEIEKSGDEREWGSVSACEPPHRVVFSWVLEKPADATEVEVAFEPKGDSACIMTLVHRGWETHSKGKETRDGYHTGWDGVLAGFEKSLG